MLNLNEKIHWLLKARRTAELRALTRDAVRVRPVPPLAKCDVTLWYCPPDHRRRDVDNLVPTLKVCCDGIVDAGVVPDDTPDLMVKHMPRLFGPEPMPIPRMWLIIRELPA